MMVQAPAPLVPRSPLDTGLAGAIQGLHTAFDRIEGHVAGRLGITRSDLACLHLLQAGPLTPRRIGERLSLTSGSVTALLDRLEARGLVSRHRDPQDRRGVRVEANDAASACLEEVYAPLHRAAGALMARYGHERGAAAVRQLDDLARLCDWVCAQVDAGGGSD